MFEKLWDHLHFEAALLFTWHLEEDLLTAPASCWHGLQIAFIEMHLGLDLAQKSHANKKLDPQTTLLKESCRSGGMLEKEMLPKLLRSPPPLLEMDMVRMMKMKNRKAELVHLKRKD
ncbi:uncharacterized protein LOC102620866 [Citrus sinensis]|uniref:uncharacterized protein LOC102620866 n=1 Tax=Citrus sinensis TaxID=2711 RepID=UPI0022781B56|nr:uncharacterized protein LOC102620866 [Citrus sinensis]